MYQITPMKAGSFALELNGQIVATFYDKLTADLIANLLNIVRLER